VGQRHGKKKRGFSQKKRSLRGSNQTKFSWGTKTKKKTKTLPRFQGERNRQLRKKRETPFEKEENSAIREQEGRGGRVRCAEKSVGGESIEGGDTRSAIQKKGKKREGYKEGTGKLPIEKEKILYRGGGAEGSLKIWKELSEKSRSEGNRGQNRCKKATALNWQKKTAGGGKTTI